MSVRKKPDTDDLVTIWTACLKSSLGLGILTNDRKLLRQQLYNCRKAMAEQKLMEYSIQMPEAPPNELWIVHRDSAYESLAQ